MAPVLGDELVVYFKGYWVEGNQNCYVEVFANSLQIEGAGGKLASSYEFNSFKQLIIEHEIEESKFLFKLVKKHIIKISVQYPSETTPPERFMVSEFDATRIMERYGYYWDKFIDVDDAQISIEVIDLMSGEEFEKYLAQMFSERGYSVYTTQKSNDQGVDLILIKNDTKIGVQAKRSSSTIGNSAIQEIVAGIKYYNCIIGMVVTNSYFTKSAVKLAEKNGVSLWDRNTLLNEINLK